MHIHPGSQNDFPGNVGGFWHLHHLAKNQLFNHISRYFAAGQQFTNNHFSQINGGNAMKHGSLTGKWRTQSAHDGDTVALAGNQR